jgi:hypothetical protein
LQSCNLQILARLREELSFVAFRKISDQHVLTRSRERVFDIGNGVDVGGAGLGIARVQYQTFDFMVLNDQTNWVSQQ